MWRQMSAAQNVLPPLDIAIDSTPHYRPFFFRPEKCVVCMGICMGICIKYRDADIRTATSTSITDYCDMDK